MTTRGKAAFRIRGAVLADLEALLALENASFTSDLLSRQRMRHWITAGNGILLVAESTAGPSPGAGRAGSKATQASRAKPALAGYCLFITRANSPVVRAYSLAIAKFARGNGLGGLLLKRAETLCRQLGHTAIQLEVAVSNSAAIALYGKLHYRIATTIPGYYEDGEDALRMRKHLKS
jgi:ribosomal protein S18 acetylase RimI-like enzyme